MTIPAVTPPTAPGTPTTPVTPTTPAALTPEQAVKALEGATTIPPATPVPPTTPTVPPAMTPQEFEKLAASDREKYQAQQAAKTATARVAELEAQAQAWADDPIAAYEAAGGTIDTYTKRIMADGEPTPEDGIARLEKVITQQQEQISQLVNAGQETQEDTYFRDFAKEVYTLIADDANHQETRDAIEAVEAVRGSKFDLVSDIRPHMTHHFRETEKQLTPAEISGMMKSRSSGMVERIRSSPAIRRIMGLPALTPQPPPPGTPVPAAQPPQPGQPPSTLTSSLETESPPEDLAALPHEERVRRAAARQEAAHWTEGR